MNANEAFASLTNDLEKTVFVLYRQWQGAEGDTQSNAYFMALRHAEDALNASGGCSETVIDLARTTR